MIRRAHTPPVKAPAKAKSLQQQKSDFTAEGAPAPALPGEATKPVAPASPGVGKPPGAAPAPQAIT